MTKGRSRPARADRCRGPPRCPAAARAAGCGSGAGIHPAREAAAGPHGLRPGRVEQVIRQTVKARSQLSGERLAAVAGVPERGAVGEQQVEAGIAPGLALQGPEPVFRVRRAAEESRDQVAARGLPRRRGGGLVVVGDGGEPSAVVHAEPRAARAQVAAGEDARGRRPAMHRRRRPGMQLIAIGRDRKVVARMHPPGGQQQAHQRASAASQCSMSRREMESDGGSRISPARTASRLNQRTSRARCPRRAACRPRTGLRSRASARRGRATAARSGSGSW